MQPLPSALLPGISLESQPKLWCITKDTMVVHHKGEIVRCMSHRDDMRKSLRPGLPSLWKSGRPKRNPLWQAGTPVQNVRPKQDMSDFKCIANYGAKIGDPFCCGQAGKVDGMHRVCPEAQMPTCKGFVEGQSYGRCHPR